MGAATTSSATLVAVYSRASVECSGSAASATGGGLVGIVGAGASIKTSYSTGAITGDCPAQYGLTKNDGTVAASYWDTGLSGIADDTNANPPEGLSTTALQTPTAYGATGIYSTWDDQDVDGNGASGETDDDAWDFGANYQHPVLKFAGMATAAQFQAQPDTPPAFAATVEDKGFVRGALIAPFEVPTANGGNGALSYMASGLPQGLSFGLPDCNTERTICGTPSEATTVQVTITVSDTDLNIHATDQGRLTFTIAVSEPPGITVAPTSVAAEEGGANGTYTVVLASQPAGAVTVTATSDNPALEVDNDATKRVRELTFSRALWNRAQTVTVTAADDPDAVAEWATIRHTATGVVVGANVRATAQDDEAAGKTNYDADADGLIEISELSQLDAVRHDLDGDGVPASSASTTYAATFANAAASMGCPDGPDNDQLGECRGYELVANVDFDTDDDGATHVDGVGDPDDDYYNGGQGWDPIGNHNANYSAHFKGNGYVVRNLFVNRPSSQVAVGLFGALSSGKRIDSLGVADGYVQGGNYLGMLVGLSLGEVVGCYSTGTVGKAGIATSVGGLIGLLQAIGNPLVSTSYSVASVKGDSWVGGLIGGLFGGSGTVTIVNNYAAGSSVPTASMAG